MTSAVPKQAEQPVLTVDNLRVWLNTEAGMVRAVDGVSFTLRRNRTFALVGESGCGKSMTAFALMRLLPPAGRYLGGRVQLGDRDLLALPESQMRNIRGSRIAMIFQEPQSSLNPVLTVGEQIGETVQRHERVRLREARVRVIELLKAVGMPDAERRVDESPHQLSGGLKQRVMIANALAGKPDLLIADEPTTALDVTIQAQVLDLLKKLQRQTGMAILLITHDLGVVAQMADDIAVMYAGQLVEQSSRDAFFSDPKHPYAQALFSSLPDQSKRDNDLTVIRGTVPSLAQEFTGCRFAPRCKCAWQVCNDAAPALLTLDQQSDSAETTRHVRCHLYDADQTQSCVTKTDAPVDDARATTPKATEPENAQPHPLLQVCDLRVHFPIQRGVLKRTVGWVKAVDGVDMTIDSGKTVALVGESGCGKTTAGKALLQLIQPTSGSVYFRGLELTKMHSRADIRAQRRNMQIVFQDPVAAMNPRMLVSDIIGEGLSCNGAHLTRQQREERIDELLVQVGLSAAAKTRYPHEFSGGQRQRICIARALAVEPQLLVCDEPTSALDVSVQAQILNLLQDLQRRLSLAYLFITHNISVVSYLAAEVAVMYLGRVVEYGRTDEVLKTPRHPYTEALLSAVPVPDPKSGTQVIRLGGEQPSPSAPPPGCYFSPRCPHAKPQCRQAYPPQTQLSATHRANCFLLGDEKASAGTTKKQGSDGTGKGESL